MASEAFFNVARQRLLPIMNDMTASILPEGCGWAIYNEDKALMMQIERLDAAHDLFDHENAVRISYADYARLSEAVSRFGMPTFINNGHEFDFANQTNVLKNTYDDGTTVAPFILHPNMSFFQDHAKKIKAALQENGSATPENAPGNPVPAPR